jgi:hypothetical protein
MSTNKSRLQVIDDLLQKIETQFLAAGNQKNGTLGDYIRLSELRKEFEREEPREIKVQWVETVEEICEESMMECASST